MSCLGSKHELLQVADHVIAHYYQRVPFVRNHPQAIDLDMLVMELMGGSIKMFPLSKDGSMLGMTAHERLIIRMELKDGTIIRDTLRPKDIVIDSSLAGFHNTGVRNFTLAHEIGHQLLHIYYPLLALSDQLEEDCADIIAEGLLLPECLVDGGRVIMKDRLKEHMEGWRFCEKCGMKLYQKIDGCSGTIHLKCHRCNTLLRIDLSFRRKK